MLYSAENIYQTHCKRLLLVIYTANSRVGIPTITPKLKLSEHARNVLLSWMRKSFLPGIRRTKISTQMTFAPRTHARVQVSYGIIQTTTIQYPGIWILTAKDINCPGGGKSPTYPAHNAHDPSLRVAATAYTGRIHDGQSK